MEMLQITNQRRMKAVKKNKCNMKTHKPFFCGFLAALLLYFSVVVIFKTFFWNYREERPFDRRDYEYMIVTGHDEWSLEDLVSYYGSKDCLPYAIYLAGVCDDPEACEQVYHVCKKYFFKNREHAAVYKALALYYLEKGGSGGNANCYKLLQNIYEKGDFIQKDAAKAKHYQELYEMLLRPKAGDVDCI